MSCDDVREILRNAIDQVADDNTVKSEMNAKVKAVVKGDGQYESVVPDAYFRTTPVSPALIGTARKVTEVFRTLTEQCEPGWDRETEAGRLNVQRVMRGCDIDQAFDRWAEGSDGNDLEVVIAVDTSGSMVGQSANEVVSGFAWTLTTALRAVGADVTVLSFGDEVYSVYRRNVPMPRGRMAVLPALGMTWPDRALLESELILRSSRRSNKLFLMITDGMFNTAGEISRFNSMGVLTAVAFLNLYPEYQVDETTKQPFTPKEMRARYGHEASIFFETPNPNALIAFAKEVVKVGVKRRSR